MLDSSLLHHVTYISLRGLHFSFLSYLFYTFILLPQFVLSFSFPLLSLSFSLLSISHPPSSFSSYSVFLLLLLLLLNFLSSLFFLLFRRPIYSWGNLAESRIGYWRLGSRFYDESYMQVIRGENVFCLVSSHNFTNFGMMGFLLVVFLLNFLLLPLFLLLFLPTSWSL